MSCQFVNRFEHYSPCQDHLCRPQMLPSQNEYPGSDWVCTPIETVQQKWTQINLKTYGKYIERDLAVIEQTENDLLKLCYSSLFKLN